MRLIASLILTAALVLLGIACSPLASAKSPFVFSLPTPGTPTTVALGFDLEGINNISSVDETFEFTGILTLIWKDPRVAFDPAELGTPEIIYQGSYQFDEVAAGWYPQVILVNEGGAIQKSGVQLRILPDGTSILKEKITAVAEMDWDMRSFPFDTHQLEIIFAILGHESDEVRLEVQPIANDQIATIKVPEWSLENSSLQLTSAPGTAAEKTTEKQTATYRIEATRQSFFVRRMITFPMAIIALLSFSIFWMDKSSLSDRNSVSFIGILTAVAYQQIIVGVMPPVSYFTFMHGALVISFLLMSATVPVNLIVNELDKRGKRALGDRIDRTGRWLFPLLYFTAIVCVFLFAKLAR